MSKDGHKGVGLTSGERNDKELEDNACGQRWGGRECADAQIKPNSPRGGELIRQKAICYERTKLGHFIARGSE